MVDLFAPKLREPEARRSIVSSFAEFRSSRQGGVAVLAAFLLAALISVSAFVVDLSILFVAKQRNQIVSDVANLAAATTTTAISNGAVTAAAVATAKNVGEINGSGSTAVTTTAVASPLGDGSLVLRTTIATDQSFGLGLLSSAKTAAVEASSWASTVASGDCLTAVLADVTILTGGKVTGANCTVRAKTDLHVCWNSTVSVADVHVGYSEPFEKPLVCSNSSMSPSLGSFTFSDTITNTYASDNRLAALKNKLVAMLGGWSYGILPQVNPSVGINLATQTYSSQTATLANGNYGSIAASSSSLAFSGSGASDAGCTSPTTLYGTFTFNGSNALTFNSGCYVFGGAVSIASGANAAFKVAAGAKVVFVFKGGLSTAANATVTFGDATYYFNYVTISNGTGSSITFGNGPLYLWAGSVNNTSPTSTMTFGSGPFYIYLNVTNNYGGMTFGDGPYYFNYSTLTLSAGSTTTFGVGDVYFYGGGIGAYGTALTFGSGGSTSTGSGTFYMVSGSFNLGRTKFTSIGMTFAFYLGAQTITDTTFNAIAPTSSSPSNGYRDILFAVFSGGFNIYENYNQNNVMSGLIYGPSSFLSFTGSSTTAFPSNGCFQMVGGSIGINTGASVAFSPCRGFANSGTASTSGRLVQ